jgi:hypothetical protein
MLWGASIFGREYLRTGAKASAENARWLEALATAAEASGLGADLSVNALAADAADLAGSLLAAAEKDAAAAAVAAAVEKRRELLPQRRRVQFAASEPLGLLVEPNGFVAEVAPRGQAARLGLTPGCVLVADAADARSGDAAGNGFLSLEELKAAVARAKAAGLATFAVHFEEAASAAAATPHSGPVSTGVVDHFPAGPLDDARTQPVSGRLSFEDPYSALTVRVGDVVDSWDEDDVAVRRIGFEWLQRLF